jgi:hypothetical protein
VHKVLVTLKDGVIEFQEAESVVLANV